MSGTKHALLGASSAERWLNCPPSARLTEDMPDTSSVYAEEGTLAHAVADSRLKNALKHPGALTPQPVPCDEMEASAETYVGVIQEIIKAYQAPPYVATEQTVDFSKWVPEGFGTADCIIIGDKLLHIVDYKYGKGIRVDAEGNAQLKLYALGAIQRYAGIYDFSGIAMTIVQPRLDHVSTAIMDRDTLIAWADEVVAPSAKQAHKGEGAFNPGDHCRFCRARATCRARSDYMLTLEGFTKTAPELLSAEEVSDALTRGKNLVSWLKDLEDYSLTALLNGQEIPGWKAVAGRSVRAWTDAEAAFAKAKELGTPEEMLFERKPISLAQLEKMLGKKGFEPLSGFVTVPPGKPALAPESDKRAAITNRADAETDFA